MLVKYDKTKRIPSMFDTFFNDFFSDDYSPILRNNGEKWFTPANDIIETDDEYSVEIMLPGIKKEDIKMNLEDKVLTIEGERKYNEESKYNVKQSYYGKFKREYTLPYEIKFDKINAEYVDGVLKVKVPKNAKKLKRKVIEIT